MECRSEATNSIKSSLSSKNNQKIFYDINSKAFYQVPQFFGAGGVGGGPEEQEGESNIDVVCGDENVVRVSP